jgi:hypothetical protein
MPHTVDGFSVQFTHRGSWKAKVWASGIEARVAPVAWTKDYRSEHGKRFQTVWFKTTAEAEEFRKGPRPILTVVAEARDYEEFPHRVRKFNAIFEAIPTGTNLSNPRGVECEVLRRATPLVAVVKKIG